MKKGLSNFMVSASAAILLGLITCGAFKVAQKPIDLHYVQVNGHNQWRGYLDHGDEMASVSACNIESKPSVEAIGPVNHYFDSFEHVGDELSHPSIGDFLEVPNFDPKTIAAAAKRMREEGEWSSAPSVGEQYVGCPGAPTIAAVIGQH